ncbi:MAG: TonB-dependent receptor, partial [Deltaproteobacteria bacterium]|nr:TonB-dependent receptor [Deltaproteobacteria bacterium]
MRRSAATGPGARALLAALLVHAAPGPARAWPADPQPPSSDETEPGTPAADHAGGLRGRIVGTVVDDQSGEPLVDAAVEVVGADVTVRTDLDGRFVANVPPGRYTVRAYYPLYTAERVAEVRVRGGRERTVDFALAAESAAAIEEVIVTARAERQTEAAQLLQRQRSATVSDTISAQEMSRSGAGTASEAARRVTGATVVDDRYVYVRGLGERYGHTLFNGVPLPSPEPDRRVVPLDIFPAGLLESFQIIKTASPDLPADFAGGSSQIATRQFPDRFVLRTGLSLGVNTQATFQELGLPDIQNLDWLAFDDGTRDILDTLPDAQVFEGHELPDGSTMTEEQVEAWGESLHNDFSPDFRTAWPDLSLSASVGDTLHPGGRRLGYAASLNYSNKLRDVLEVQRSFSLADVDRDGDTVPEGRELIVRSDYAGERATNGVLWGALGSAAFEFADGHETSVDLLYTRKADNDALRLEGKDPDEILPVRYDRLRYVSRSLLLAQLRGRDEFRNGFDTDLRWQANVSLSDRSEPDTREVTYQRVDRDDGSRGYEFLTGSQSGAHFTSALDEVSGGGGVDWTLHLPRPGLPASFKLGGLAQYRDRHFGARRFRFLQQRRADRDAFLLPPDELFAAEHIGPDLRLEESTRVDDTYDATQLLGAAYSMFDLVLFPGLRTIAGVRFEYSDQQVVTRNPYAAPGEPPVSAGLLTWDIFPSINLVYAVREGMNLRCGVSQTTARPEFREL